MGCVFGNCYNVDVNEQLRVTTLTDRTLRNGPILCTYIPPCYAGEVLDQIELQLHEFCTIVDTLHPENGLIIYGPARFKFETPYQEITKIEKCPVLDQDDYLFVTKSNGTKHTVKGPCIFRPCFGDTWTSPANALIVPINSYIIVENSIDTEKPVRHLRGPLKFIPEPYEKIQENKIYPCVEITRDTAIWLHRENGEIVLVKDPQYFMPEVGEKVVNTLKRVVLTDTDFCIVISQNGDNILMDGKKPEMRQFFLQPFWKFREFTIGGKQAQQLSILPQQMMTKFDVRTNDNVVITLDLRINYQIEDSNLFSIKPIEFYEFIRTWCQNELLDSSAKVPLRSFLTEYYNIAHDIIALSEVHFTHFGIKINDIQVLNYVCADQNTQKILDKDIETNVIKQNELKAKQIDVSIKEKENEIAKQQKDLELVMTIKDKEIEIAKKELEAALRMKEVDLQIEEEKKQKELIEIRRQNDVAEQAIKGKAGGHYVREFFFGIGADVKQDEKIKIWNVLRDLDRTKLVYDKVDKVNILMHPKETDVRLFQFTGDNSKEQLDDIVLPGAVALR